MEPRSAPRAVPDARPLRNAVAPPGWSCSGCSRLPPSSSFGVIRRHRKLDLTPSPLRALAASSPFGTDSNQPDPPSVVCRASMPCLCVMVARGRLRPWLPPSMPALSRPRRPGSAARLPLPAPPWPGRRGRAVVACRSPGPPLASLPAFVPACPAPLPPGAVTPHRPPAASPCAAPDPSAVAPPRAFSPLDPASVRPYSSLVISPRPPAGNDAEAYGSASEPLPSGGRSLPVPAVKKRGGHQWPQFPPPAPPLLPSSLCSILPGCKPQLGRKRKEGGSAGGNWASGATPRLPTARRPTIAPRGPRPRNPT